MNYYYLLVDGLDVKDFGDIETSSCENNVNVNNMNHLPLVSACNKNLSERVSHVLKDGRIAVTVGGDHSIGVGQLIYTFLNAIIHDLVLILSRL